MTPLQAWLVNLVTFALGIVCQILAVRYPSISAPLATAGGTLLLSSNIRTILAGPTGPTITIVSPPPVPPDAH